MVCIYDCYTTIKKLASLGLFLYEWYLLKVAFKQF